VFRGRHDHSIDTKGRLSIPASFRALIQKRGDSAPVLTNYEDHLALYPSDDWKTIEASLMSMSDLEPDAQDYRRFIVAGAIEAPIDNQGRILIPGYLREHAELGNKAVIAGVLEKIEIWNPERFAENQKRTLLRLKDIQRNVDASRRN